MMQADKVGTFSNYDSAKKFLQPLIEKNHRENHIIWLTFRANHVVHGICTLYALGAREELIEEYYTKYIKNMEKLEPPKFVIDESNYENYIQDKGAYSELLRFFDEEIKKKGVDEVLRKYLPRLIPGLIGALYHPLIHIAFGVEFRFPEVVAEGLAYAITNYSSGGDKMERLISSSSNSEQGKTVMDIIEDLEALNLEPLSFQNKKYTPDEVMEAFSDEMLKIFHSWKILDVSTEKELEDKFIELIYATIVTTFGSVQNQKVDFFLMHQTTCLQAIRIILKQLESMKDKKRLLRIMFLGLLVNLRYRGLPKFSVDRILDYNHGCYEEDEALAWECVMDKAILASDEHVAKVIRAILVIRSNVPNTKISHKLLLNVGLMLTDYVKDISGWGFKRL